VPRGPGWHHEVVIPLPAARLLTLVVLLAGALGLSPAPARAAVPTVTLSAQGPSPARIDVSKGAQVTFVNSDGFAHTVQRTGANAFTLTIPAGGSARTPVLSTVGSFAYTDAHFVVSDPGTIVVTATAPSPTASASPRPSPTRSTSPAPAATPKPPAAAAPGATPGAPPPTAQPGTAVLPGFGPGLVPTPRATAGPPGPAPALAPPVTGTAAPGTAAGPDIAYGGKAGLVQHSAHRYGLPALLSLVGIVGVLSLLVRFLLAQPVARRTGAAAATES
jgi:plastocyanin